MNNLAEQIDSEPVSLGRITVDEINANPDLIRDKLDEKIKSLLDKYGYGFKINGFQWTADGGVQADIIIVQKPTN